MELFVFGLNHRTAPVAVRERWSFSAEEARRALEDLKESFDDSEHVILSTCNRTEFYGHVPLIHSPLSGDCTASSAVEFYTRLKTFADDHAWERSHFYVHRQKDAVEHLFRLAGGLDSMILGESQIQRQIKDAFVIATEAQTVGKLFRHLFSAALRAGKRIRTDTGISEGCITPGQAALKLANESLGSLAQRSAVLIGSGKIATLTAKAFRDQGIRDLVVVNRTQERADAMVEEIGVGTVASWNDLRQSLVSSDVVISSTGSVDPIVGAKWMRSVQKDRGNRPLAIVDLAVPRDFEPEIGKISAVNLFNFDDLNTVIEQNISERHRLVPMAEEIIQRELRAFHGRVFYLEVDPVLKHVIERFEQIRLGELQKHISQFPPEYHPLVMELTSSLVKKLLHFPIEKLKSLRDLKGLSEQEVAFLKRLFLTRP